MARVAGRRGLAGGGRLRRPPAPVRGGQHALADRCRCYVFRVRDAARAGRRQTSPRSARSTSRATWSCCGPDSAAAAASEGLRGWWRSSQTFRQWTTGRVLRGRRRQVSALRQRHRQGSVCLPGNVQLLVLKSNGTSMLPGTGWPLLCAGVKRQRRTASVAARSSSREPRAGSRWHCSDSRWHPRPRVPPRCPSRPRAGRLPGRSAAATGRQSASAGCCRWWLAQVGAAGAGSAMAPAAAGGFDQLRGVFLDRGRLGIGHVAGTGSRRQRFWQRLDLRGLPCGSARPGRRGRTPCRDRSTTPVRTAARPRRRRCRRSSGRCAGYAQ